jgi:hypothetical protein
MSEAERFDRIESALLRLSNATEAGFAGTIHMVSLLKDQMLVLDGQMIETLGRLRIIGEQLASHAHPEGA